MNAKIVGSNELKNKKDGSTFFEYFCTSTEYVGDGIRTLSFLSDSPLVIGDDVKVFYSRKYNRYFMSTR